MNPSIEQAIDILTNLARAVSMDAEVRLSQEPADTGESDERATLEITGDETGILIGKQGATLDALQYLTNLILHHKLGEAATPITVDTLGYRAKRREHMLALAADTAEEVRRTGRPTYLEGLTAADRRHVHIAIRDMPDIVTESRGEGRNRVLVVSRAK